MCTPEPIFSPACNHNIGLGKTHLRAEAELYSHIQDAFSLACKIIGVNFSLWSFVSDKGFPKSINGAKQVCGAMMKAWKTHTPSNNIMNQALGNHQKRGGNSSPHILIYAWAHFSACGNLNLQQMWNVACLSRYSMNTSIHILREETFGTVGYSYFTQEAHWP